MKALMYIGVCCAALVGTNASPALAQDTAPAASGKSTDPEIVVTAERRATNLQRAPLAATVLTGKDLLEKGINSADQLQQASPSLTVNNGGQNNKFNIRGIGLAENGSALAAGVVTYRDGVATFPSYFQTSPYYDIASIEVLRGPQGTFAGGNATGGAVFVSEANPTFDKVAGFMSTQYGNYNDMKLTGAVNVPLSDTLALRVATSDERRDTFYTITGPWTGNPGNLRSYNGRISLLWQPDTHWRVLIKGDYSSVDSGGYPADPAVAVYRPVANNDLFTITSNANLEGKDQSGRIVGNVSYTTDSGMVLRSITGYQVGSARESLDADGSTLLSQSFSDDIHERIWSEEFNIVSPDRGPLTWLLGGYYQNDLMTYPQGDGYISGALSLYGTNPKTALAAFGQVGYKLTDALQLQLGARWSRTTASNTGYLSVQPYLLNLPQNDATANRSLTGKIALNWTISHDHFLYAFVATGAKAGGINLVNLALVTPRSFDQEHITDYEIGWKASWLGNHLHTQLGGYYNHYTNFQVTLTDPTTPTIASVLNVPNPSQLYGAEFSAQGRFGALGLDLAASVEHTSLGTLYAVDSRLGIPAACNLSSGPATAPCTNLTGTQQPYAPKFTVSAGVQYAFALGHDTTLTPRVDFSHTAAVWATIFENAALGDRIDARNLTNMQMTLARGPWSVTSYATNVTNLHYVSSVTSRTLTLRVAGAPRQFGVRVNRSF